MQPNDKDDLWAEFQKRTGASKRAVTPRTAVVVVVIVLLAVAVLAFR